MARNLLKLNDGKTDNMSFGSTQQLKKLPLENVPAATASITPSENVRNLGVVLDSNVTMTLMSATFAHQPIFTSAILVASVCSCLRIPRSMPFVTSRLDMGNALLYSISQSQSHIRACVECNIVQPAWSSM